MTNAKVNYNFEESLLGEKQVVVANSLGRALEHLEIVSLDGYFGEVRNFDGVAIGANAILNIAADREVRTTQIETTDTFVLGGVVYFVSGGSSAAGKLRSGYIADGIPVGTCTYISAGVAIGFRPYDQKAGGANIIHVSEYNVDASAATAIVLTGLVPVGAKIVDVIVQCKATVSGGTLQLRTNAGSPAAITNAITCAVTKTVTRVGTLENDVVTADGLQVVSANAGDRGIMTILWR